MKIPPTLRTFLIFFAILTVFNPISFADEGSSDWAEVDRLIDEDKYEAASNLVAKIHRAAREANAEPEWTRALIKQALLRTALHGYETSVRFLRDEPWPTAPRQRLVLELFHAQSLVAYAHSYSWEMRQRERVASIDEVDLKKWTLDQVAAEAQRAYFTVWKARDAWGEGSLGDLAEYFETGNYPAHVRGTLRDAVTYLWVGLLSDTSLWRPEHSNEIHRLDLETLLDPDPSAVELNDPATHPLLKITAVLGDLETWHQANERPDAAFEARLERIRRLWASLSQRNDRAALRDHLEERLEALGRQHSWWSLGMATLAEFVRQGDGPNDLVEARRIALEGERAHPESIGGQRCRHIVAAIERPAFDFGSMKSDGLNRRSLRVQHQNLPQLHFRAYALDLVQWIEDGRLLPDSRTVANIRSSERPLAQWTVELPETPDYRRHATYVTPPLDRPSLYLVVASARRDFSDDFNELQAVQFILGDLVLLRDNSDSSSVRVVSGATGKPRAGVEVLLYHHGGIGHQRIEELSTGADGVARFESLLDTGRNYFVVARRGDEVALLENIHAAGRREPREEIRALIYTDRGIYRPRQKVFWKVVAYRDHAEPGRFDVVAEVELDVTMYDANGEVVDIVEVTTNSHGSTSGEFEIPSGRFLGEWSLEAALKDGETLHEIEIQVEEYKRPTFEVEVGDPEAPLRLNQPAKLNGTVRYYFGLPVTAGDVSWQVEREPVWSWYRRVSDGYFAPRFTAPQVVASGAAALDADGRFEVGFTPEVDERLADDSPGLSYRYRLSVDVTDDGGETRSASRAFRLGFVSVEASLSEPPGFFRREERPALTVKRSDLDGHPRAGAGRWRLVELVQPDRTLLPAEQPARLPEPPGSGRYRTPGDLLRPRWDVREYSAKSMLRDWPDGKPRARGEVEHGADGQARITLPRLKSGLYRLHYATDDDFGATAEIAHEILVLGGKRSTPLAVPALLELEETSVPVGGTARLAVHTGLSDQQMELSIHRGDQVTTSRFESQEGVRIVEIPVSRDDHGGFGVTLHLVRDHQLITLDQRIFVPWDDRELQVEFETFRDTMRPGETEIWRVRVQGADDQRLAAGTAELLTYMYDKSLDLFVRHRPMDPMALYPYLARTPGVSSTLGSRRSVWRQARGFADVPPSPRLLPDRLQVIDGYGVGGPGRRSRRPPTAPRRAQAMAPSEGIYIETIDVTDEAVVISTQRITAGSTVSLISADPVPEEELPELSPADTPRSDFSETAFWEPHLITDADGSVSFEFTVPDSLTEWSVWVHALTRDLRSGRLERRVRTAKELMVRAYLPRFLREGDQAKIRVVVNNAGESELRGQLDFEIRDPESDASLLADFGVDAAAAHGLDFAVEAGGGTELSFPVRVPSRLRTVALEVRARAAAWSDGERRALPVLPSRIHLARSRFVTLRDRDRKLLRFEDLARDDDPTRIDDQLVVTLDAQLFYGVLQALPYLVNYPYGCVEQTLNRFLSTGIVSSLYDQYPAVARMAAELAERETLYEAWDEDDPNRKMALEETPWLNLARGGSTSEEGLIKVLDPKIAAATRDASLARLDEAQTSSGGFSWWSGGPPSSFMTLYLVDSFARALEFGVEVPRDMVVRAWSYLYRYYVDELARDMVKDDCCWEGVTYLNYILSNYPDPSWTGGVFTDDDRKSMLEFSLRHRRRHSPRLKSYLALTLHRAGRAAEAHDIFEAVMDSASTTDELGTYWAPEDRAWLWYNDTIESHAFALRAMLELGGDDARRHGLVQWLFLNKHLGHWKSTRATAEVIYSLVHYLEAEGTLGVREEATVQLGTRTETLTFEPERYSGKDNRIVVAGDDVDASLAEIEVSKETPGFLFASATWHFSTEELPKEARGDFFSITRRYFRRVHTGREWVLEPLEEGAALAVGDRVEVHLSLRAKHAAEYVHLRDPRGAGFEPETLRSGYRWDFGLGAFEEVRDSGTNFFFERLPVGEYTLRYRLRANVAGIFRVGPATIQSMYAPEFVGYSSGAVLSVTGSR